MTQQQEEMLRQQIRNDLSVLKQTSRQPSSQPQQNRGFLGKVAGTINRGYEAYTNFPVIKQFSQAVGGGVGGVGGVVWLCGCVVIVLTW